MIWEGQVFSVDEVLLLWHQMSVARCLNTENEINLLGMVLFQIESFTESSYKVIGCGVPEIMIVCSIQNAHGQHTKFLFLILFLCNYYLFYFAFFTFIFWHTAQEVYSLSYLSLCIASAWGICASSMDSSVMGENNLSMLAQTKLAETTVTLSCSYFFLSFRSTIILKSLNFWIFTILLK